MHIWAIAGAIPTASNPSKAAFYVALLDEFTRAGHRVSLAAPSRFGFETAPARVPDTLNLMRATYFPAGRLRFAGFDGRRLTVRSFASAVRRSFERSKQKPDALFAHFLLPAGLAAGKLSEFSGIPAFCSLGESRCETWFEALPTETVKTSLSKFRLVFPVASHIAGFLQERCDVDRGRIAVIPNGIDHRLFYARDRVLARARLGAHAGKKIALFVGSADPRKGGPLLQAAGSVLGAEWEVWLVGHGHRRSAQPNVRTFAPVLQTELPLFYSAADVFVLPSMAEGMPNSLLEAMACGTPSVASRIPPTVEILGGDYAFYCTLEPSEIAAQILRAYGAAPHQIYRQPPLTLEERASRILAHMTAHVANGAA